MSLAELFHDQAVDALDTTSYAAIARAIGEDRGNYTRRVKHGGSLSEVVLDRWIAGLREASGVQLVVGIAKLEAPAAELPRLSQLDLDQAAG